MIGFGVERSVIVISDKNGNSKEDEEQRSENPNDPNNDLSAELSKGQKKEDKKNGNQGSVENEPLGIHDISDDPMVDFG